MKFSIVMMALCIAGCASYPEQEGQIVSPAPISQAVKPQAVINNDCAAVAKYTKAVVMLKEIGVIYSDVEFILPISPTGIDAEQLRQSAYFVSTGEPSSIAASTYAKCINLTYAETIKQYNQNRELYISNLQSQVSAILIKQDNTNIQLKMDNTMTSIPVYRKRTQK